LSGEENGRLPIIFKRGVHPNGWIRKSGRKKVSANRPEEDGGEKPFVIGVHDPPTHCATRARWLQTH
jgi:hypothetical protein